MNRWRSASFLLILAIGTSIAETVQNAQEYTTLPESVQAPQESKTDTGKLDYESALRPAVLQKRSIANIARLLLGGNVPPNHPLVKYPDAKAWNLASNIVGSLQGSSALSAAASTQSEGWARQPSSTLQNIQQLFETKAKIIPYTGQVATGLTGLASVKGDLIRQIHSISTQAIAQAAAEAAARALASAAAAHAVTNSIAHSVNPGAQTGIKGGWSSYQNTYAEPPYGKTPGEQPGPPYQESAHINHYQPPPSAYNNPYSGPASTPSPIAPTLPSPYSSHPQRPQQYQPSYQNNGYYTLYNTQPSTGAHVQTPYTPAPPIHHARPTLSPNTLIATTPSGYSPSLSNPLIPNLRKGKTLPVIVYAPGSNNTPLNSFRRAAPAGIFGRNAAQPSSTSSLLSTISSLLSASTAAYNAALTGVDPSNQQQSSALFSNLLSSASSPLPATPTILRPTSPVAASSSLLSSGIGSTAYNNGYQQQQFNSLSQGGSNYGGIPSRGSTGYLQHQAGSPYTAETRSSSVNSPSYSFNQHGTGNYGANYAQPGTIPYASQSVQSSSQFASGSGRAGAGAAAGAGAPNSGAGSSSGYSTTATIGFNPGSRYTGYNGGAGPSSGHAHGWNTQYAGPSVSASTWPSSSNIYPPGYAGQTPGNINNSPGGFGGSATAQFPVASGSAIAQQAYSAHQTNAYQSPATNPYAQAQSYSQQSTQLNYNPNGYSTSGGNSNSIGGRRNSDLASVYDSHDLNQSASNMGNDGADYNDDDNDEDENRRHSYQPANQRHRTSSKNSYSGSRYPSPSKKRPSKRPSSNNHSYSSSSSSSSKNNQHNRNNNYHKSKPGHSLRKDVEESGKRVIPTGPKKGSHFDSSAVDVVDASVDDYNYEGDRSSDSDEMRKYNDNTDPDTNKNRWRTKNPSGQRPNSFHNHHSNGRWSGEAADTNKASSKNVLRNGGGSERSRAKPGQSKGTSSKNIGNKKVPSGFNREQEKKHRHHSKTEAAQIYRGRVRPEQQQQQQKQREQQQSTSTTKYKSNDVYTTLPEYVFQVGERPDVFLRPGGKRKQGSSLRGRGAIHPRLGETDGTSSSSSGGSTKEETLLTASSNITPYDEAFPRKSAGKANLEKSRDSKRPLFDTTTGGSKEEESASVSEAVDETARADFLSDQIASDSGFITAEEFDPEEREAFVDDVYADKHNHHRDDHRYPLRRQDYEEEEGIESTEPVVNEESEEDPADKK